MMRRLKNVLTGKRIAILLGALMIVAAMPSAVLAEGASDETPANGSYAPFPRAEDPETVASESAAIHDAAQAAGCIYTMHGDNPYGDAPAHRWWAKHPETSCPISPDVEVWLEAHYCAEGLYCWWITQIVNEDSIKPKSVETERLLPASPVFQMKLSAGGTWLTSIL